MLRKVKVCPPEPLAMNELACFVCSRYLGLPFLQRLVKGEIIQCVMCGARHQMQMGGAIAVIGVRVNNGR